MKKALMLFCLVLAGVSVHAARTPIGDLVEQNAGGDSIHAGAADAITET